MAETSGKRLKWGRWLFLLVLVGVIVAYCIAWFKFADGIGKFADKWEADQREAGITIDYSDRRVEGFPLDFQLVYDDAVYGVPTRGMRWQGDQLRLHSRTWDFARMMMQKGGKLSLYAPGDMMLDQAGVGEQKITLGPKSALTAGWQADGKPTGAALRFDTFDGMITPAYGEPAQPLKLDGFEFEMMPGQSDGFFDLQLSWDGMDVPEPWLDGLDAQIAASGAPPPAAGIARNIATQLRSGEAASIPMPNVIQMDQYGLSVMGQPTGIQFGPRPAQ